MKIKTYSAANKQAFIDEVLIPRYQPLLASELLFTLKDAEFKRIVSSHLLAQKIEGMEDGFAARGLTEHEIGVYDQDTLELINAADLPVKQFQRPVETVYTVNGTSIKAVKVPIFYPNGDFFGIRTTLTKLQLVHPYHYIQGLIQHKAELAHCKPDPSHKQLTELERSVLFLLLTGQSRVRIAAILHCHLSKVARIITNLCDRFGIMANHQERLLAYVIKHAVIRDIPRAVSAATNTKIAA